MDAVSLGITVVDALVKLGGYISEVLECSKERGDFQQELVQLQRLVDRFCTRSKTAVEDPKWREALDHTPLFDELRDIQRCIDRLDGKLKAETRFGNVKRQLKWPRGKKEVADVLASIERTKSALVLVLVDDIRYVLFPGPSWSLTTRI